MGLWAEGSPPPPSFSLSWGGVCAGVLTAKALASCLISIEFPALQRSHLWGRCEEWSQTIGIILLCHWGWHGVASGVISPGEASLSPLKDRHLRKSRYRLAYVRGSKTSTHAVTPLHSLCIAIHCNTSCILWVQSQISFFFINVLIAQGFSGFTYLK